MVKQGVTLRGNWVKPSATQSVTGTILKIYQNRNNANASAFITLDKSGGVRDLAFWYPEQVANNIVPYPYTVTSPGTVNSLENITLVNAYQGLNLNKGSFLNMKHIYGSPLALAIW